MVPLRRLTSTVLMFTFLATLLHGPLRLVGRADNDPSDETGLDFRKKQQHSRPHRVTL